MTKEIKHLWNMIEKGQLKSKEKFKSENLESIYISYGYLVNEISKIQNNNRVDNKNIVD